MELGSADKPIIVTGENLFKILLNMGTLSLELNGIDTENMYDEVMNNGCNQG